MKHSATQYKRYRFPPEIIQHAVWVYYRFNLSHRDIEDLLARRGIFVTHESIRFWCNKFGPQYAHRLRRRHRGYGDTLFIDEVFVRIQGRQRYLWRAVDQDGEVVDVLLQERRDATSAERFFRHLLTRLGHEPRAIVTDKLGSYAVAHRELLPGAAAGSCCRELLPGAAAGSCCRELRTTPVGTRTIGLSCRINRPGYESGA
jgi:putative transposase